LHRKVYPCAGGVNSSTRRRCTASALARDGRGTADPVEQIPYRLHGFYRSGGPGASTNGEALTQLSATRPHTPVFLAARQNVISAANGHLSVDYYVRDGGDGTCTLP